MKSGAQTHKEMSCRLLGILQFCLAPGQGPPQCTEEMLTH